MSDKYILIIDDEQDVITYLTAILETNGFISSFSLDTKSAMEKIKEQIPSLICLDIMMPKETGISFYTKLKQNELYENIPIFIISGVIETGKFDFRKYVPDKSVPEPECFFEKPINVDEFINKINDFINNN